jgi:prepilin-type N-terminal cleavage/methylation domain-containing protein
MTMTTRRGFTLVELLIGLILLIAVGAVTYQLLVNTQRVSRSQSQHIGMQDNGRSGALIIANELRELGYDQMDAARQLAVAGVLANTLPIGTRSDLIAIGPDSITYRAPRGIGYICNLTQTNLTTADVVVYNPPVAANDPRRWNAYRSITTTDSLMLFVEDANKTSADDFWLTVGLTANQSPQNCPDGTAGIRFRIQIPGAVGITAVGLVANTPFGNPVRAFEVMQLRSYTSNGKAWLGMRPRPSTLGTTIEPVVGPLSGTAQGLTFTFKDANDGNTTVADNVRSVQIALQPMSDEMVRTTGKYAQMDLDTVTTRVSLRNALRP